MHHFQIPVRLRFKEHFRKVKKRVNIRSTHCRCSKKHGAHDTRASALHGSSLDSAIRRSFAGQVALTSGPLAFEHCNDSPRHREPSEIISSGPRSVKDCLHHCLLRTASHGNTLNLICQHSGSLLFFSFSFFFREEHLVRMLHGRSGVALKPYVFDQINVVQDGLVLPHWKRNCF